MIEFLIQSISNIFFYRAWSKMLNFSDDGGPRPEKATILWKWLMEHIANSRKDKGEKSVSGMRVCIFKQDNF